MESFRIIDPLTRVKDHKYIYFPDDEGLPTYLSVDESLTPPLAFEVVRRALEELGKAPFKKGDSLTFECASVKWLLRTGEEKLGWLESLAGRVHAIYPQTVGFHFLITRVGGWIRTPPPEFTPDVAEVPFVLAEDALPFSDPFTELATVAFQRFETFITHKDGFKPASCDTRIVREGEKLLLVGKEDPRAEDKELRSLWYDYLVRTHGERRIREIFSRYELDLETLTPEHVYRVNVGLLLWDRAELTALSEKPLDALSAEEIEALMSKLELDDLSLKRALTGREIYLVKSYSTVVDSEFKPWVEAQEVAQTYQILRSNSSWPLFMEKCAHVLSKRHLARTLPEGGYRTGLLLPAPREAGKPREWYEVTWLISNPRGLHSYVLEPLWKGSKLPVLFVDRSTAQNSSALRSSESVLNDLNSLSAPGNEGRHLSEPYLNAVIDRFTVPLWVAYAVQAQKKIAEDPEQALFFLQRANSAYLKEKKKPVKRQSLRELIRRRHDVTINALYRACAAEYWKWRAAAAMQVYPALLSHVSSRSSEFADERAVAETLFRQLDECLSASSCPQLKGAVEELKQDLHYHVLYPEDGKWEEKQKEAEESLAHLSSLENERQLHRWCELLLKEAFERGEHPSQKQALPLVFAGHSLGGACAQVNLVRFFAERGRMPLQNCAVTGWFFQEPAINDEDNEKFKRWALKHKKLLFASGVQFSLIRREETGDIVPLGGEAHLGATYSPEEGCAFEAVVRCDFRVRRRLETGVDPFIAYSRCAHETQFEGGTLGVDYTEFEYGSEVQGEFDSRGLQKSFWNDQTRKFERIPSTEGAQEIWKKAMHDWGLSAVHGWVEGEWVRTSRHLGLLVYMLSGSSAESRIAAYLDARGVFAVNSSGVQSKDPDKLESELVLGRVDDPC